MSIITGTKLETIENSAVKLTLTISKDVTKNEYSKLLKEYSKKAVIKGFRKGKVPTNVLETKYGEGIKAEAFMNLIDSSLNEAFETVEKKPLGYSRPELVNEEELKFDLETDFSFSVIYDTFPEFELANYKGIEYTQAQVTVGKKELDEELKKLQQQSAIAVPKKDGVVANEDIVTVDFVELNADKSENAETKREDFTFTVGTGYNTYKIDEDIIGMKLDEEKAISKKYPEDFEDKELAGKEINLKVKVTSIKVNDIPALDDEFAQDIDEKFETLEDLKKSVKADLEKQRDGILREQSLEQIFDKIQETTEIVIPNSMVESELESNFQSIAQRFGISAEQYLQIMESQGKKKSDIFDEWRADVTKNTKNKLILGKIVELENIEVSDEDFNKEITEAANLYGKTEEEMKKMFEARGMKDYLLDEIKTKKAVDLLIDSGVQKKGEKKSFVDLIAK
ncbi:MAG: trigger factor [Spirochaetales bacterium]|nr:trigger factor [Spirochaetales bacterium]